MSNNKKPDFIGIGIRKSATTWIFKCLQEHPEICGSSEKEIHFFSRLDRYRKGVDYYLSFFDHCKKGSVKGEFTTNYIFDPRSPELIHKHFPDVKLIACIRNPIERAYSGYRSEGLKGKGSFSVYKSFKEAIDKRPRIVTNGLYYERLKRYYDLFPKENILVMVYEDIKKDPVKFIQEIYKFLEVDSSFVPRLSKSRVGYTRKKGKEITRVPFINTLLYRVANKMERGRKFYDLLDYLGLVALGRRILGLNKKWTYPERDERYEEKVREGITPEVKRYLLDFYKEDIKKTEDLIKKDLSSWKN